MVQIVSGVATNLLKPKANMITLFKHFFFRFSIELRAVFFF
jgi:hypothetical protein